MDKIKIIFLDIDGVLRPVIGKGFNKKCVNNLNELIEKTGSKIVISSTWRYRGIEEVKKFLSEQDFKGDIIDITPIFNIQNSNVEVPRGMEIKEWLSNYTTMERYVESYVIIDDSEDIFINQLPHYVKVDQTKGFDTKCLKKSIDILNIINIPTI